MYFTRCRHSYVVVQQYFLGLRAPIGHDDDLVSTRHVILLLLLLYIDDISRSHTAAVAAARSEVMTFMRTENAAGIRCGNMNPRRFQSNSRIVVPTPETIDNSCSIMICKGRYVILSPRALNPYENLAYSLPSRIPILLLYLKHKFKPISCTVLQK